MDFYLCTLNVKDREQLINIGSTDERFAFQLPNLNHTTVNIVVDSDMAYA